MPTSHNITKSMYFLSHLISTFCNFSVCLYRSWLVKGAKPGDSLFFSFSGHGNQMRDIDGDETDDGMDETILPVDYREAGKDAIGSILSWC